MILLVAILIRSSLQRTDAYANDSSWIGPLQLFEEHCLAVSVGSVTCLYAQDSDEAFDFASRYLSRIFFHRSMSLHTNSAAKVVSECVGKPF